ncbi:MAG: hypothetical protein GDA39_05595 [Hyphomonadaceae bacterium]|nr:hypothetical protein [Hyphomonadaceae bacterium]MBC6412380.1 hypothetical protein [Hyphomonadaceae bacterium]
MMNLLFLPGERINLQEFMKGARILILESFVVLVAVATAYAAGTDLFMVFLFSMF